MAQSILQWNCRSILNKKSDLIYLTNKYGPFIIALSEIWLKPDCNFRLPGFTCLRDVRVDGYAGCALLVKEGFSFSRIMVPSPENFHIVAARVNNYTVVSLYIAHTTKPILLQLSSILESLPPPLFILGDFNCHHRVWGSGKTDSLGEAWLELIHPLNLCILNTGSPTRRSRPNEVSSVVDLSLCSPCLASQVTWGTLDSSFGSDHFPILIEFPLLSREKLTPNPPLLKFNLLNADWTEFRRVMSELDSLLPPLTSGDINHCAREFSRVLNLCAEKVFPVKNAASGKIPSPPGGTHSVLWPLKTGSGQKTSTVLTFAKQNLLI